MPQNIYPFSPQIMNQETLEEMFVQREQLLRSIVEDLAASVNGTKQYLMLVGARGMGKTHLASLVYHRLKEEPELQDKLLIAWLPEEYGVNSWLYLIIEILRSLSREERAANEQITKLTKLPIDEAEYLANHALKELIGDRTLLIIVENIDRLLEGLGTKEQWKFRAFLQENNSCSIFATTPRISDDFRNSNKPFFGFFTPIHLSTITAVDGVEMLTRIADLSGTDGLVKFLETNEGKSRVCALHHLTQGNPLIYSILAQLITEETLGALLPAVIEMLDKLMPYYRSRVEDLGRSDDQQKIVMYLAQETRAVTVKEITAQCFISSDRSTSNALKKLRDKGYLVSEQHGREVYYEISDVLMRLCLGMRHNGLDDLKLYVDFLRIWYASGGEKISVAIQSEHSVLTILAKTHSKNGTLAELGVALVRYLEAVQSPVVSDYTAAKWLNSWQQISKLYPDLAIALKMLKAGIEYKKSGDSRAFLDLPQEMRSLLKEALGFSSLSQRIGVDP
jgi:DNA-binding transcriptional ArsR family regulator